MPLITPPYSDIPTWTGDNYHDIALNGPAVTSSPDYTLHIDGVTGERRKLHEFLERVADGATALGAPEEVGGLGLKVNDGFVGIMSENCLDYPAIVYALFKIAVPISFIPSLLTPSESISLLRLSYATTLFVSPRLLPIALAAAKQIGLSDDRIFVLGGRVPGRKSFSDLVASVRAKAIPRIPAALVKDNTVAYMVFSSGTSGLPKGVLISHKNIYTAVTQISVLLKRMIEIYQFSRRLTTHLKEYPFTWSYFLSTIRMWLSFCVFPSGN
ncbi:hypothetical protein K488DRAFT_82010 [Vararia minispora EC-137]|uniref:Uncharacterized protein n=1 Tax=Vararia minispora EC-137 TaxID=1314806 RepID=A0ACB8QYG1_9AGAM|nr:hypothetical protein K488DRAFT_82010 [Vararia minispora EC-137]